MGIYINGEMVAEGAQPLYYLLPGEDPIIDAGKRPMAGVDVFVIGQRDYLNRVYTYYGKIDELRISNIISVKRYNI